MLTINDITPTINDSKNVAYNYQNELTAKLDNLKYDFDQNIINEIVLWKVSRYALLDTETLKLINQISKDDTELDLKLTNEILSRLLSNEQKGVRLAMASTILRFKNPKVYQIIDQRVFRIIYGKKMPKYFSSIETQINLYLEYLQKLRNVCNEKGIKYELSDRIIYELDKEFNKDEKISY